MRTRPLARDLLVALLALLLLATVALPVARAAHAHPVHVTPVLAAPVVEDFPGGLRVLTARGWATCLDGADGSECGDAQVRALLARNV